MTKPAFIQALEQRFSLDFALDDTTDAAIFSRYGRRGVDACRYWLRDEIIVGLCARASGIDRLDWLDDPAKYRPAGQTLKDWTSTPVPNSPA